MTHPVPASPAPTVTVDVRLANLADLDGLRYVGAAVPGSVVARYLEALRRQVGADRLAELTACKARRDGPATYHVTAVSPPDLRVDVTAAWARMVRRPGLASLHLYGIGSLRTDTAVTYYIIADSPAIQALRAETGLPPATLHVTLGFTPHDIYGRPKGSDTHLFGLS
ncbi:hypothetical protein U2F26_13030 [Micromonospora sp. 4G57]|uniref:Swiss Army Knife 2H phosphoesterase domain-containing protein n=1 Tax=Micromonospora sicca TaxID=2202420 RepID=A0ABU5J8N4_9ACTN|nr:MULTISPECIES: hypothetical protein [unclassified Micromonospora]MDZ5443649.1 hypothetical protein [Micromonospora sp. 4G57]MDZ5488879.1 hypothetical protein [Micromonospora sp. 4G53]